jgi:hypothetical protein
VEFGAAVKQCLKFNRKQLRGQVLILDTGVQGRVWGPSGGLLIKRFLTPYYPPLVRGEVLLGNIRHFYRKNFGIYLAISIICGIIDGLCKFSAVGELLSPLRGGGI